MIALLRNVRENIDRPLIRAEKLELKPKSIYFDLMKDILFGCYVVRTPPSGHILSASTVFPPVVDWDPAHCELIISPVTLSFVLSRLALTVVRGSTCIKEISSSTSQILQTLQTHRASSPGQQRRRRNIWVMHQVVGVLVLYSVSVGLEITICNVQCSLGLKDLEM